jgi:predicted membrane metal-binding protein
MPRRLWALSLPLVGFFGVMTLVEVQDQRYPLPFAAVGVLMVVAALILWRRRDWRDRYPELSMTPATVALSISVTLQMFHTDQEPLIIIVGVMVGVALMLVGSVVTAIEARRRRRSADTAVR